jgi:hypothetical protein
MGTFSAVTMGIAVLLAIIFAGVQDHPFAYVTGSEPIVTVIPIKGTSFVLGMSAFLNISYTFIGQATLPSVRSLPKESGLADALSIAVHCRDEEPKRLPQR